MQEIGLPMPNDAVLGYISNSGAYSIIPILSKNGKEINGLAFYPMDKGVPDIIPKNAINRDLKSRTFIQSPSFTLWKEKGYTLSVKLDPLDCRTFSSSLTKSLEVFSIHVYS